MKKLMTGILLIVALVLVGCADHYPEYAQHQAEVDDDNKALVAAYFGASAARDGMIIRSLADKGDSSAAVLYAILQGQRDAGLITAFRSKGLVAPTTSMDVWNTVAGKTVPTALKWGFGYLLGSDLIEGLSTGMAVGGDYTSFNASAGNDFTGDINFTPNTSRTWTDSFNSDFRRDYVDNTDNSVRPPETTFP